MVYDDVSGTVTCPKCGTLFHFEDQMLFLRPDLRDIRDRVFEVGSSQDISSSLLSGADANVWEDEWWRVRAPRGDGTLSVLVDYESLFVCHCSTPLVVVLDFALTPGPRSRVTLTGLRALDARDPDTPTAVDFASGKVAPLVDEIASLKEGVTELGAKDPPLCDSASSPMCSTSSSNSSPKPRTCPSPGQ